MTIALTDRVGSHLTLVPGERHALIRLLLTLLLDNG